MKKMVMVLVAFFLVAVGWKGRIIFHSCSQAT